MKIRRWKWDFLEFDHHNITFRSLNASLWWREVTRINWGLLPRHIRGLRGAGWFYGSVPKGWRHLSGPKNWSSAVALFFCVERRARNRCERCTGDVKENKPEQEIKWRHSNTAPFKPTHLIFTVYLICEGFLQRLPAGSVVLLKMGISLGGFSTVKDSEDVHIQRTEYSLFLCQNGPSDPHLKVSKTITDGEPCYYCDCVWPVGWAAAVAEACAFIIKHRKSAFNPGRSKSESPDMFTTGKHDYIHFPECASEKCCRENWPPELLRVI